MELVKAGLEAVGNFILPAVWFLVLDGLYGMEQIPGYSLFVLLLFPIVLRFLRSRNMNFAGFFITHLSALLGFSVLLWIMAGRLIEAVLFTIFLIVYTFYSFYIRRGEENREESIQHPAVFTSLLVIAYLIQNWYLKIPELEKIIPFAAALFMCIYFVYYFLENYSVFTGVNRISAGNFQEKKLFNTSGLLAGFYIVLSVLIFVLLARPDWGKGMTEALKNGGSAVFGWLLLRMRNTEAGETEELFVPKEKVEEMEFIESDFWGPILAKLLNIVLIVVAIVLVTVLVVLIARWIYRLLGGNFASAKTAGGSDNVQDIVEQLEKQKRRTTKRGLLYGMSNNGRIRKLYAAYVKRNRTGIEENLCRKIPFATARECIGENAEIYEQARYSSEECSGEQLRAFKSCWQK